MTQKIQLTQGKVALVDDEDFDVVNKMSWAVQIIDKRIYAVTYSKGGMLFRKRIYMHRFIMNTPAGFDTDHIDMDGLNNQKNNLRICTRSENMAHRRLLKSNTSGYKGVYWRANLNKYESTICVKGESYSLGFYINIEDAARAYDEAAKKYFKDFAVINFP